MKRKTLFLLVGGIVLRLVFAYFFTYVSDFRINLTHFKSIALTGDLFESVKQVLGQGYSIQLYGKIWYYVGAVWILFLDKLHILSLSAISIKTHLPLIQQWSIKLIQLLPDLLVLFFTLKIAEVLKIKKRNFIVLFWAFNPVWIFVCYGMMQADIAMMAFLMAAVYFALLPKYEPLAFVFLGIAYVIKQMPLFLLPVFLLLLSRSPKQLIGNLLYFLETVFIAMMPWANDFASLKSYSLLSRESFGIFHTAWNGASLFAMGYILSIWEIGGFGGFRGIGRMKGFGEVGGKRQLISALTLVILVVYFFEEHMLLFPQFMVWVMPFMILLVAQEIRLFPLLFIPFTNFVFFVLFDNVFASGALSDSLGVVTHTNILTFVSNLFHAKLASIGMRSVFMTLTALGLIMVQRVFKGKQLVWNRIYSEIAVTYGTWITLIGYQSYFLLVLFDWLIQIKRV